jgi:apolipoprotein D and lipocalin family protein
MKYFLTIFGFLILLSIPSFLNADVYRNTNIPLNVIKNFDVNNFLGKWYEIARFPFYYEKGCYGVTSEYSKKEKGTIEIQNTCFQNSMNGEKKVYTGEVEIIEPGKLSVSFVQFPILKFLTQEEFWILHVNEQKNTAVIGNPKGTRGWILSKTKQIKKTNLKTALEVLKNNGYDTSQIIMTLHE